MPNANARNSNANGDDAGVNDNTFEFSSTEMLKEVRPGDNTVQIAGFVESIIGTKTVGRKRSLSLFKFVLNNNNGKRITVLIWEDQIQKYEQHIKCHEKIKLEYVKALPIDSQYMKTDEDFVHFEISIQRNSIVTFCGPMSQEQNNQRAEEIQLIQIKYAAAYTGLKEVQGFINVQFSEVATGSGSYSFASGSITDGQYKLRIQVAKYGNSSSFTLGKHVKIQGYIKKDKYGSILMQIEDCSSIKIIDSTTLTPQELKNGYKAPLDELPKQN